MLHLKVVWPHEQVGNALAHDTHDPLIKVLGLASCCSVLDLCLNKPFQAVDLQHSHLVRRVSTNCI